MFLPMFSSHEGIAKRFPGGFVECKSAVEVVGSSDVGLISRLGLVSRAHDWRTLLGAVKNSK
jgi:hypothetical protein